MVPTAAASAYSRAVDQFPLLLGQIGPSMCLATAAVLAGRGCRQHHFLGASRHHGFGVCL